MTITRLTEKSNRNVSPTTSEVPSLRQASIFDGFTGVVVNFFGEICSQGVVGVWLFAVIVVFL